MDSLIHSNRSNDQIKSVNMNNDNMNTEKNIQNSKTLNKSLDINDNHSSIHHDHSHHVDNDTDSDICCKDDCCNDINEDISKNSLLDTTVISSTNYNSKKHDLCGKIDCNSKDSCKKAIINDHSTSHHDHIDSDTDSCRDGCCSNKNNNKITINSLVINDSDSDCCKEGCCSNKNNESIVFNSLDHSAINHHHKSTQDDDSDSDCCNDGCCSHEKPLLGLSHEHSTTNHSHNESVIFNSHDHSAINHKHNHKSIEDDESDSDCCNDGCCSVEKPLLGQSHEHSTTHHSHNDDDSESDCCNDGCCSHDAKPNVDLSHDHSASHNHNTINDNDSDCCNDGCCSHDNNVIAHDHVDHSHGHDHNSHSEIKANHHIDKIVYNATPTIASLNGTLVDATSVSLTIQTLMCNLCDITSNIPHAYQITRLRVANLCCSGEERLIRTSLESFNGIESVNVNVIGRYAVIKHCPVECCAPIDKILDILNYQRLGVTIQELNDENESADKSNHINYQQLVHFILMFSFFIIGIGFLTRSHDDLISMIFFVLSTSVGVVPVMQSALLSIRRQTIDIHILMLLAIAGAIASAEYFDASLLVTLFTGAEYIEAYVLARVRKLIDTSTSTTNLSNRSVTLSNGKSVKVSDLKVGDIVVVRTGDMICVDGVVVKGEGSVSEAALTGESKLITKSIHSKVISGSILQNGYIEIQITVDVSNSTIQQLQTQVYDLQANKGRYNELIDQFSNYWTPLVLLFTICLVVIGGSVTNNWNEYVNKGLVLLVLACPCAIVIACPIPSVCAIALAAKHGTLIKGSSVIEKMCTIDTVAIDKTGTLTKGFCKVVGRLLLEDTLDFNPLELAAAIENKSTHPLASAIVSDFCGCIAEMESDLPQTKKIKVIDGVGISGSVNFHNKWYNVIIGNERILNTHDTPIVISDITSRSSEEFITRFDGSSIVSIVVDSRLVMLLAINDEIREESRSFVSTMTSFGFSVTMLTGDHETVAKQVCNKIGLDPITSCRSRLIPLEKLQWIENQQNVNNRHVLMIGDGINDATALSVSTIGAAMGEGGSAMTIEAADIIILSDNLLRLPATVKLCKFTSNVMLTNCFIAIVVKIVAVVLAIIGMLSLWNAVLVDLGTLLVVIFNGIRPLNSKAFVDSNLDKIMKSSEEAVSLKDEEFV